MYLNILIVRGLKTYCYNLEDEGSVFSANLPLAQSVLF